MFRLPSEKKKKKIKMTSAELINHKGHKCLINMGIEGRFSDMFREFRENLWDYKH